MSTTPRVRAVVLNYNGGAHVERCIDALLATDYPADLFEVVLVDNASIDGSDAAVAARFPSVRIVPTGANLGFPANNLAMVDAGEAGFPYVALVNNDAFVEPGWLRPLVDTLEADARLGAACPKMLFAPRFSELAISSPTFDPPGDSRALGVQLHALNIASESMFGLSQYVKDAWGPEPREGGWFRWLGAEAVVRVALPDSVAETPFVTAELLLCAETRKEVVIRSGRYEVTATVDVEPRWVTVPVGVDRFDVVNNAGSVLIDDGFGADRGYLQIDDGRYDTPIDVFNWCGGGVLLRTEYLADVGLFDERFFLYYEDTDVSWRGQAMGWRYRYVPASQIRHLHAASSGENSDMFQFHVERNRLLLLVKNAPFGLALRAVIGFVTATLSYARRDVLPPLVHRRRPPLRHIKNRIRSFRSFLTLAPAMVADRRTLRHRRLRNDAELASRWITRAEWTEAEHHVWATAGNRVGLPSDDRSTTRQVA